MTIAESAHAEVLHLLQAAPAEHKHAIVVVGAHDETETRAIVAVKVSDHWRVEGEAYKAAGKPWAVQAGTVISW